MPDSPELQSAKHDGGFLRSVLKVDRDGQHCKCPICGDTVMRVGPDKSGSGVYMWQCMKECGAGTVVDALMTVERKTLSEAISLCEQQYGGGKKPYHRNGSVPINSARTAAQQAQAKREAEEKREHDEIYKTYPEPVINLDVANAFVERALKNLLERRDLQEKWLSKRQISLETCKLYRVGFLDQFDIHCLGYDGRGDWDWRVHNGWVLPLTDRNGVLKAVKIHFEGQQGNFKGKSTWMQFGTFPAHDRVKNIRPHHSYVCLWPHPYQQKNIKRFQKFERDQNWWISQAPEDLRKKYSELELVAKADIAMSLGCRWEEIPLDAIFQAQSTAFNKIKPEIMRAVIQQNNPNATEIRVDDTPMTAGMIQEPIYIQPGELKALSLISKGRQATSCSEGAPPSATEFACFKGRNVVIVRDDDEIHKKKNSEDDYYCTGLSFPIKIQKRLARNKPRSVRLITYGRKEE